MSRKRKPGKTYHWAHMEHLIAVKSRGWWGMTLETGESKNYFTEWSVPAPYDPQFAQHVWYAECRKFRSHRDLSFFTNMFIVLAVAK